MSTLKHIDRIRLEKFLEMGNGYVCDFNDRTFQNFVIEQTEIDPYASGYDEGGTSKANRLRTFWKRESNLIVVKLMKEMLSYWKTQKEISGSFSNEDSVLHKICCDIVDRIGNEAPIKNVDVFSMTSSNQTTKLLSQSIKDSIKKDRPQEALDRLHAFVIQLMRELSAKHSIPHEMDFPLHSLFGGYIKFVKEKGLIKSEMSEKILKSPISLLKAFNEVRNDMSLAHPNELLNYDECVLIFNNITNTLKFISEIEKKIEKASQQGVPNKARIADMSIPWDDLEYQEETPEQFEKHIDALLEAERQMWGQ